jgi:hypothetical protein
VWASTRNVLRHVSGTGFETAKYESHSKMTDKPGSCTTLLTVLLRTATLLMSLSAGPPAIADQLTCGGTEPFWDLQISGIEMQFARGER